MHPVIFTEYHQSKRHLPWQLLALLCTSAAMQYILGLPAVFLFLSPGTAAAIGVGTLSEEYSKGTLRFFYSLPISPLGFWFVKLVTGIVGTTLFVSVVWLPALLIDKPMIEVLPSDQLALLAGGLLAVLAGQAILAYAAGMFTIGFCQVPSTALLLATMFSIIPFLVFGLAAVSGGLVLPSATELGLGLAVASLPLWIGAVVLFRGRNPFVDQPWQWRGKAAFFGVFYCLLTIGVGYGLTLHPAELTDPYRDGVYYFSVFGDDSKVFVLGRRTLWDVEGYVLDSDGRLARHLLHVDQAEHLRPEPWLEETASPFIHCFQVHVNFRMTGPSQSSWFLLNLDSGAKTPFEPRLGDRHTNYTYLRPGSDGRSVMGYKQVYQDGRYFYFAFRQDMITSDGREIPISDDRRSATCHFLDDRRVLVNFWPDEKEERKIMIVDVESGARTVRQPPAEVHTTYISPDGRTCAALRWTIQGDTVRQELAVLDVSTGRWTTVLSAEELPLLAVKDALTSRQPLPSVFYPDRHSGGWMICSVHREGKVDICWLINRQTSVHFQMAEKDKGEDSHFSKDGSQFFTVCRSENDG